MQFRDNTPYDEFVTDLLISTGSNFRSPTVNFYRPHQKRTPEAFCKDIALIFLGQRSYPKNWEQFFEQVDFKQTKEWKEEIIYLNKEVNAHQGIQLSDNHIINLEQDTDYRVSFTEWLVSPENHQFARSIVNRIWYWSMGRGIVHECDNMSPENLPANPELLDYLTKELINNDYDLKHIFKEILVSEAFSRSSIPNQSNINDIELSSHYPARRQSLLFTYI